MSTAATPYQVTPADSLRAEESTILIFGASGDLTARKLIPALFTLWRSGYLPGKSQIVGVARREKTDQEFRNELFEAVKKYSRTGAVTMTEWEEFAPRLHYRRVDLTEPSHFTDLNESVGKLEQENGLSGKRVVYLAVAPSLFQPSVAALHQAGMIPEHTADDWMRVVIEKPFGRDLESARQLSRELEPMLHEDQIYRIDHYLGKETVQNILLFRFGNGIFEPLLNRNHVDHVQITVAEDQGIERGRGGYYDKSGALRDVLQNHVLQLLCLVAMEPPALFSGNEIRDEKMKVLQALSPGSANSVDDWAIAGQYSVSEIGGLTARGYREEDRVDPTSRTETYVAMEAKVDNWRWAGVPFYMRTGKRLPKRVSEIAIQFKLPPLNLFTTVECEGDICDLVGARPNQLIFRIQPQEAISLKCSTKRPGMQYQIHPVTMDFQYNETFSTGLPEAYERLLLDVMRGDSTLFTRSDELEAAWKFVQPVLDHWGEVKHCPEEYQAGTWGPAKAHAMLEKTGRYWRAP